MNRAFEIKPGFRCMYRQVVRKGVRQQFRVYQYSVSMVSPSREVEELSFSSSVMPPSAPRHDANGTAVSVVTGSGGLCLGVLVRAGSRSKFVVCLGMAGVRGCSNDIDTVVSSSTSFPPTWAGVSRGRFGITWRVAGVMVCNSFKSLTTFALSVGWRLI